MLCEPRLDLCLRQISLCPFAGVVGVQRLDAGPRAILAASIAPAPPEHSFLRQRKAITSKSFSGVGGWQ